ncbi:MAG: helix-turn-helix domain-containing protein [Xanthobacteraceae bacterium]
MKAPVCKPAYSRAGHSQGASEQGDANSCNVKMCASFVNEINEMLDFTRNMWYWSVITTRNGKGAAAMSDEPAGIDEIIDGIPVTKPRTLSVEEAGRILGISRMAAYQAVWRGQIPSIRIGRRLLIPLAKLNELLGERAA